MLHLDCQKYYIVTENGPAFTSAEFTQFMQRNGIAAKCEIHQMKLQVCKVSKDTTIPDSVLLETL